MLQGIFEGLKEFIARDLIYIVGGGSVLAGFLYRFHLWHIVDIPVIVQFLAVGIAFVTGYALQDTCSWFGLITTAPNANPSCPIRRLFRRFTGEPWPCRFDLTADELRTALENLPRGSYLRGMHERAITITMVSATMMPCSGVVSGLLFWKWFSEPMRLEFDLTLGIVAITASILFGILNRLKAAQLAVMEANIICRRSPSETVPETVAM